MYNINKKMSDVLVRMVFPSVFDNSISQQALPDDPTLSVLPIFRGSCFQVYSPDKTFLSQTYVTHAILFHNQLVLCVVWHPVVQPCISWASVMNIHFIIYQIYISRLLLQIATQCLLLCHVRICYTIHVSYMCVCFWYKCMFVSCS